MSNFETLISYQIKDGEHHVNNLALPFHIHLNYILSNQVFSFPLWGLIAKQCDSDANNSLYSH